MDKTNNQICNQGVGGSSPSAGTTNSAGSATTKAETRTGSRTTYYLEAWGKSWRIVDPRRGWGFRDSVAVCQKRDDALLILGLLNGGRG